MLAVVVWRTLFDVVALGVCIRLVVLVVCGVRGVCVVFCLMLFVCVWCISLYLL